MQPSTAILLAFVAGCVVGEDLDDLESAEEPTDTTAIEARAAGFAPTDYAEGPGMALEPEDPGVVPALAPDPLVIYVAPGGSRGAAGDRPATALGSLQDVSDRLVKLYGERLTTLTRDVEVRVLPGRYVGQRTAWKPYNAKRKIKITGWSASAAADKPTFVGCTSMRDADRACSERLPWFQFYAFPSGTNHATNLYLVNMKVTKYFRAIAFVANKADDNDLSAYQTGNVIHRMFFFNIGTLFDKQTARGDDGYPPWSPAVIAWRAVRDSVVAGNTFRRCKNRWKGGTTFFHALYLSQGAKNNRVVNNVLRNVYADFHTRNQSDGNRFAHNEITNSFYYALVTDWTGSGEKESCDQLIGDNTWAGDFRCQRNTTVFTRTAGDGRCARIGLPNWRRGNLDANRFEAATSGCTAY